MIKLNNKNITYVALADSANSLKAPKEIWYADSNNSVKLVYRRKDALIEGEDYEKYHWLVGDGNAYINTLITKFDGIVDISFYFSSYNGNIFGRERGDSSIEDYSDRFVVAINNNDTPNGKILIFGKDAYGAELSIANDERLIIDIDNGVATNKNGDTAIISVMANVTGRNLYLFADNYRDNPYYNKFNGRIGLFSISNKIYLIPCKLLKPVPKWLDANGIRRNVGECGMIDLVSGKFYGNVASSGTFKAVNLAEGVDYEVHQWLVVPYTQNDANALPIRSNNFNFKYKFYSFGNIAGVWTENKKYAYYPNYGRNGIWGSSERTVVYSGKSYELNTEISINCDGNGITMDGELMPNYGSSPYFDSLPIYCYNLTGKYALSSITVDGIERYIPVKLLRPIPSKYDANGIARQAGECGMYDTVNDVFYGNVASSGTFSVSDDS